MIPLVVLVRKARPVLSAAGLLVWLFVRLSPFYSTKTTLLQLIMDAVAYAEKETITRVLTADSGPSFLGPWLEWVWRVVEDIMAIILLTGMVRFCYCLYHVPLKEWKDQWVDVAFDWARENIWFFSNQVAKYTNEFSGTADKILAKKPDRIMITQLPAVGRNRDEVCQELESYAVQENKRWQDGRVSGTVYSNDEDHTALMNKVYSIYSWSNPLHAGYWPKVNQCEGEVIAMTANMLNAPEPIGCISSGGTESICLAIRAHLHYYGTRRGVQYPELICGTSAHAAVNKACEMFGIRMVVVDCNDGRTYKLNPAAVRRKITSNTIMIYASAPAYPQGVIDPIAELSDVALGYGIGLHVDCCLGGFVLPFCEDVPVFDFRNPGVTSISADTHKYGFASKGTSVLIYRSNDLRHKQYFAYPRWTGGLYMTPTIAGSRPGALSVCAWAAMQSIGQDGYVKRSQLIMKAARELADGGRKIPGIKVLTDRPYMVVCFASDEVDIYGVQDCMSKCGWSFSSLQNPASIHLCVTLNVVPKVPMILADLQKCVEEVRKEGEKFKKGTAGIYGACTSLPNGPVEHLLRFFVDRTLAP